MLLIDHYVAKSTIHGLGVFSAEYVPKGQKLWEFHPTIDQIVPEAEFEELPCHVRLMIKSKFEYLSDQKAFLITLDGDQFMNHSDHPNSISRDFALFAARDVHPGDEMTCDYRHVLVLSFDPETGSPHTAHRLLTK
jgi:uncharacterized protein